MYKRQSPDPARLDPISGQLREQGADSPIDLIANDPDLFQRLASRVSKIPVDVALTRIDRAGIATPHGDHDVGSPSHLIGQSLGPLVG